MASDPSLERTIDKILGQTESEIVQSLKSSLEESQQTLSNSLPKLEQEYDKIISDGNKEADKLEKQLIGSSDLGARNKELLLVEESIDRVFDKAIDKIKNVDRNTDYSKLITTLLDESTKILGSPNVTVFTNDKDRDTVQSVLSQFSGAELSSESIDCMGGIIVKSKDGTMTFDNTIDARLDRMKPLIRKEIASKFGIGN